AVAQVADQVPVQRRGVGATRLGVGPAEREVDRAGDLLVEQRVPGGPVDSGVGADPELPQEPGSRVGGQRRVEIFLALGGDGLHDLPVAERQAGPGGGGGARGGGGGGGGGGRGG